MKEETLKQIVELAPGFEWVDRENGDYEVRLPENNTFLCSWCNHFRTNLWKQIYYPFLLRRAVEGWNGQGIENDYQYIDLQSDSISYSLDVNKEWQRGNVGSTTLFYNKYQKTEYLTPQEQAIEACLIELLESSCQ